MPCVSSASGGQAIPAFWTGVLLILLLVIWFEWSPPLVFVPLWEDPPGELRATGLAHRHCGLPYCRDRHAYDAVGRVRRRDREDYIRTAWAKGS